MSNRGVVYDLGYTPYEGDHLGRRGAIRSTYRDGIYRVLGIKRRARKKILPWTLAAFAVLPAIVFVGFAFLLTTFSPDAESPFGSHADYFELTGTVVLLFVALAAPELLIPDRREGVLSIYSSRPLLPDDYVGARFVSLLTVIAGFMLIPQVLMYVGFAALDADGFFSTLWSNAGDIPRILASTAVYAVAYAPIALLVATIANRKSAATGVFLGGLLLVPAMLVIEGLPTDVTNLGRSLIVYMGIASTFVPFMIFYVLLRTISATSVSLIGYLVPLVALVGGILILNEQLEPGIAVGGLFIFAGMILTDRAGRAATHESLIPGPEAPERDELPLAREE